MRVFIKIRDGWRKSHIEEVKIVAKRTTLETTIYGSVYGEPHYVVVRKNGELLEANDDDFYREVK